MATFKRGPWSDAEYDFVLRHYDSYDVEWIAEQLGRRTIKVKEVVHKFRTESKPMSTQEDKDLSDKLHTRAWWKELRKQFSESELDLFEYEWKRMILQFREDITPYEESQLKDLLVLELLKNRNLVTQQNTKYQIEKLSELVNYEYSKPVAERDHSNLPLLQTELSALRASQTAFTKEHSELLQRQQKIGTDLKATRDQRLKIIDDSKSTFKAMMAAFEDDRHREKITKEAAIRKYAMEKELDRLSEYHTYIDGEVDQPILTSETILGDNNG